MRRSVSREPHIRIDQMKVAERRNMAECQKYLGATGPNVLVEFTKNATDRYFARLYDHGLDMQNLIKLIREPEYVRPDKPDPDRPDRIERWTRVNTGGASLVLRVVFLVRNNPLEEGSISVVHISEQS